MRLPEQVSSRREKEERQKGLLRELYVCGKFFHWASCLFLFFFFLFAIEHHALRRWHSVPEVYSVATAKCKLVLLNHASSLGGGFGRAPRLWGEQIKLLRSSKVGVWRVQQDPGLVEEDLPLLAMLQGCLYPLRVLWTMTTYQSWKGHFFQCREAYCHDTIGPAGVEYSFQQKEAASSAGTFKSRMVAMGSQHMFL